MRMIDLARHEARRRHILAAAPVGVATKGFQDTRTADTCAAAGMSSGNLFHYFPSKQAIRTAIFEGFHAADHQEMLRRIITSYLAQGADGTSES